MEETIEGNKKIAEFMGLRFHKIGWVDAQHIERGDKNHQWKGDNASYTAFHYRVRNERGKADHCEECGRNDSEINKIRLGKPDRKLSGCK